MPIPLRPGRRPGLRPRPVLACPATRSATRGTFVALIGAALLAAGGPASAAGPDGAEPLPGRTPDYVNEAMGIGEPRKPQPFTREQRLLHAVRENDRPTVERALALGVSVHARDDLGRSALLLAVRDAGSLELVEYLHAQGARIDEPDVNGRTPLSWAAARGRLALVRYLVEQGAVPDARDAHGRSPLFYAAIGDHPEVVSFLAARGAALDADDRFEETPLIAACAKHANAAARRLLELGADPTRVDRRGRSARDRARGGAPACAEAAPPAS